MRNLVNLTDILDLPMGLPPPGVTPNFENPVSRSLTIDITAIVCLALVFVFASFRLYAKTVILRTKSWSDVACIFGFVGVCSWTGLNVAAVHFGAYGLHQWDYKIGRLTVDFLRLLVAYEALYPLFLFFVKSAIFFLYLDIFSSLRWLKMLIYLGLCVTGVFYATALVTAVVLCAPSDSSQLGLLIAISSRQCTYQEGWLLSISVRAFNCASDIYLLCIPLPAVWSLQMTLKRKAGVLAIFLTGILAVVCSIVGLVFRYSLRKSIDPSWDIIPLWVISMIEIAVGFIISCMPSAAAVYRHAPPKISQFLSTSWKRFQSFPIPPRAIRARDGSEQMELQPRGSKTREGLIQNYTHLPDSLTQPPTRKTVGYGILYTQPKAPGEPVSWTSQV